MGFWEGLGKAVGSVAKAASTQAETQRKKNQASMNNGYYSGSHMSDEELKSEIRRMKANGGIQSYRDAGTVKAAKERFSK